MLGIRDKQLEQGESKDEDMYKRVGTYHNAPQIAVFTAGGDDLGFGL
jgi:hypothetical protein